MKKISALIVLFALLGYSLATSAEIKVVDGDSLVVDGERVRLLDIDAPEFFQTCRKDDGSEYKCGKDSLNYLRKMVEENDISCECEEKPDKYGRKLCECFAGEMSLNREMVRSGWAVRYGKRKYAEEENDARRNKRGVWQGKFIRPALYRILNKRKN